MIGLTHVADMRRTSVLHYCMANMLGAAPLTSTYALSAATGPYVEAMADEGVEGAFAEDKGLARGLDVRDGELTHPAVIQAFRDASDAALH